MEETE
jgi:hypothetical protein